MKVYLDTFVVKQMKSLYPDEAGTSQPFYCAAVYDRIQRVCKVTGKEWYSPTEPIYEELGIPKRSFFRCKKLLQKAGLIEGVRGFRGQMRWRSLVLEDQLEDHFCGGLNGQDMP